MSPCQRTIEPSGVFALLASFMNAFIVVTIVLVIFGNDYVAVSAARLHRLCARWNVLNVVRMLLSGSTAFWLFAAFRKLDRASVAGTAPPSAVTTKGT